MSTEATLEESRIQQDADEPNDEKAEVRSVLWRYSLPSLAAAGTLGLLELARSRFQKSQVFDPSRFPEGEWDPTEHGFDHEDVDFESEDGTRLHAWYFPHRRATQTLVYCHGNRGSIADRLDVYRFLGRLKVNVFAFDYRGFGRSEGKPTEAGVCADTRAAVDYVAEERGAGLDNTILFGHSLGGAIAIDAALDREVSGLVVESSFTQIRDMARDRFPEVPVHWIARNQFRSIEKVPRLEMPKLFVHGTADETTHHVHSERLYEAAAEPKKLLRVPRAGHNDLHLRGSLRYVAHLIRFVRQCRRD